MKRHFDTQLPADLADVAQRLTQDAPRMSAIELDELKRRVTTRDARKQTHQTRSIMRARFTFTSLLAAGILMTSGGATLAVSGLANRADEEQYGTTTSKAATTKSATVPSGTLGATGVADTPQGAAPSENQGSAPAAPTAQAPRQVAESGGGNLPFTGYAGIPVLLIGIALLASGLVLRRNAHGSQS
jgi:hypothetical protein